MRPPTLTIIAGCNGSGKSTFSKTNVNKIKPFDYDKRYLEIYKSLYDSEFREKIAKQKATQDFESSVKRAFSNGEDFCYETNFDTYPVDYAKEAKKLGYKLHLYFYCLDNLDIAKKRVAIRTDNKGHFVRNDVIEYKWQEGYKNLNLHFQIFDFIQLIDNSKHLSIPINLFSLSKNTDNTFTSEIFNTTFLEYSERRFPLIHKIIID